MTLPAPEPQFVERDGDKIFRECVADFEARTGTTLQPNQPEWQMLATWAYRETLIRISLQQAAVQNLLDFAEFPIIDFLGRNIAGESGARLPAQAARTTLRFSVAAPAAEPITILAGARRATGDKRATFATEADATIKAGQTFVDALATATEVGTAGNGYLAGQVNKEVDVLPAGVSCENITTTGGGAARENTPRYRERLLLAPAENSTAGAEESYRFHALSASQAIEDVAVLDGPGNLVRVVLLDDDGSADELIPLVDAKLSDEKIRPLKDEPVAEASGVVNWQLQAELILYKDADADSTLVSAITAADEYVASRRRLGRLVDRGQVLAKLIVPGVHSCNLIQPAANVVVAEDEWPRCVNVDVTVAGVSPESEQ